MNSPVPPVPGQVLHGGARRLPTRWVNTPEGPPTTISRYAVAPGCSVSRHVHTGKAEYWVVVAGSGVAEVGAERFPVAEGDLLATPPGVPHALHNTGDVPLVFVNVVARSGTDPVTTTELGP